MMLMHLMAHQIGQDLFGFGFFDDKREFSGAFGTYAIS